MSEAKLQFGVVHVLLRLRMLCLVCVPVNEYVYVHSGVHVCMCACECSCVMCVCVDVRIGGCVRACVRAACATVGWTCARPCPLLPPLPRNGPRSTAWSVDV